MYCYLLGCQCQHLYDFDDRTFIEFPVKFRDQDQYQILEGDGFDNIYDKLG